MPRADAPTPAGRPSPEPVRTVLRSDDLSCPSCVRGIEATLAATDGVYEGRVHFATGRIEAAHDPTRVSTDDLIAAIARLGYRAARSPF